jgi:tetratricopeptide (TPR) repeat protein
VNLGILFYCKKEPEVAIAQVREAIRLKPNYGRAHCWVGILLGEKGDRDGAITAYRNAIACDPGYNHKAHNNLAVALGGRKDVEGAIAECRKAIAIDPSDFGHHHHLFLYLLAKGDLDGAITACHEVSQIQRDEARARNRLEHIHRLVELDAKLPRILKGEVQPADNQERLALADYCQCPCKSLYGAACRFYVDAFSQEPNLAAPRIMGGPGQLRYNAACAAALAGCGQGNDADEADDKERSRLRRQALDWLRTDLAAWCQLLEKESGKARPVVLDNTQLWQQDKDLAGVRGWDALAKLPEAERKEWQKLWAEVDELRQKVTKPVKQTGS